MTSFIDDILEQTKKVETPRAFIQWACYAAVSAVAKNNVKFNKGGVYNLFPNIYVMLIAKSGMRKGYAQWLAVELVSLVKNTRIISGQNSIQGVLVEMQNSQTSENGGGLFAGGEAFLTSEEFSTFLIEDPSAYGILTTLYDTHAHEKRPWTKRLRDNKFSIKQPCLTMLGASNMKLLEEVIPKSAYEGGFLGRMMIVYEQKRRVKNSLTNKKDSTPIDLTYAGTWLAKIAAQRGDFILAPPAQKYYDDWYMKFDAEGKDDPTGFIERVHDHILKMSMLVSLTRRCDMIIEESDIKEAMDLCMLGTKNIKEVTGKGKSNLGEQTKQLLMYLVKCPDYTVSRKEYLRRNYHDFSAEELDKVANTLMQAKAISMPLKGGEVCFVLDQEVASYYNKLMNGEEQKEIGN